LGEKLSMEARFFSRNRYAVDVFLLISSQFSAFLSGKLDAEV
jgi:hypothetical protein